VLRASTSMATMTMETANAPETSVNYYDKRRNNPEYSRHHACRRENLKYYILLITQIVRSYF
jgi:hypothetical protein